MDAFTSHVVIPKDNHFDFSNNYDTFSGLYASTAELLPWQESQVYFLARNTSRNSPNFETWRARAAAFAARHLHARFSFQIAARETPWL